MAVGDAAVAAGMTRVTPDDLATAGATEIMRSRDYILQYGMPDVLSLAHGGTGATTAAGARDALGLGNTTDPLPVANGGTGASDAAAARNALAIRSDTIGRPGVAGSVEEALNGIYELAASKISPGSDAWLGHIYTPNGRNTPVATNYVSAYLNSDGRIGASPSSIRFKRDIAPRSYTLADAAKIGQLVVTYRLKAAVDDDPDAGLEVGLIAEALIEAGFAEFVMYEQGEHGPDFGRPFSIAYERMVVIAFAAFTEVATRLATLEEA